MLADQFPSVIVGRVDFPVRSIEEGDIILEPIEVAIIPEVLGLQKFSLVKNGRPSGRKKGCKKGQKQGKEQSVHLQRLGRGKAIINPNFSAELHFAMIR